MNSILTLKNVHKSYGKFEIIKGISFDIKEGEIFGFLGANGAGKTTTIRMIVGLIKPNSGEILINNHSIQKDFVNAIRNVGCIVENPDMYEEFTGRENLKIFAKLYGNIENNYINEIITLIGLKDRIDDKVKKYSLGMKQRLGLGQALLSKPKLLILDEPTNGLDPVGIIEFRQIIKDLVKKHNTSILISSHILSEIDKLCDRVAFIDKGEIKSIETVKKTTSSYETVLLKVKDKDKFLSFVDDYEFIKDVKSIDSNNSFSLKIEKNKFYELIENLVTNKIEFVDIRKHEQNLEERFIELTKGGD